MFPDETAAKAWRKAHRIHEAFKAEPALFSGPVQIDRTCIGGKRRSMPSAARGVRLAVPGLINFLLIAH